MHGNASSEKSFDPFQVFEVERKPCYKLTVTVLRGRNIVEAAQNFVDTPDPYVRISLSSTSSPNVQFVARTATQDDSDSPEWNHTFFFLVDLERTNFLNIQVFDDNLGIDTVIGKTVFDLRRLKKDKLSRRRFTLKHKGRKGPAEVDIAFLLEEDHEPDLRFGISLNDEEREFLVKRQQHAFESLKKIFGNKSPKSVYDVPGVAVAHSGGGVRAMVASCGVLSGLHKAGLLDVVSYMTGISGSTWYMSHLYAHPDWPEQSPSDLANELKEQWTKSFTGHLLRPDIMYQNVKAMMKKRKLGQAVSLTDFFGFVLGKRLQPNKFDTKLTDQAALLKTGKVPMPIFVASTVKNDVMASKFNENVECTAFEVAIAKYGIAMKTEHFGSKFFMGRVVKKYPEPPLHFFQGIWGSAWAVLLQAVIQNMREIGICCCGKTEKEDAQPQNPYANSVLIAKKLKADLQEGNNALPMDDDVETLGAKDNDVEDSDKEENPPAWYRQIHYSAEQNALNKQKNRASTVKVKKANQVSPEKVIIEEEVEAEPMTFLDEIVKQLTESGSFLGTRTGRAATVFNYLYGLDLRKAYPISPFTQYSSTKHAKTPYPYLDISIDSEQESICMVDAGLAFELPFSPLLRPQRNVDIILSFDYTRRTKDYAPVFTALKEAETWAKVNQVPFPKIDESIYDEEGMKEVYVFQNHDDPLCPVVLHFPLVNLSFKDFKNPGVPRETKEEKEFGDFDVYEDGEYKTMDLTYSETDFDRLLALMEYNVLNNSQMIKDVIQKRMEMKTQQRQARMAVYKKAINNMADEDAFKHGLCQSLKLDSAQEHSSSKETIKEQFMALIE